MGTRKWILNTIAAVLGLAGAVHADVLTVGSGGDFTSLQDAVDAAADGDVILLQQSSTGETIIDGKGLSIVGDTGGAPPSVRRLDVRNVAAGQELALVDLDMTTASTAVTEGLRIRFCSGGVRVVACTILGGSAPFCSPPIDDGLPAAVVAQSSNVVFSDCTMIGGSGADSDDDPNLTCLNQGIGGQGCFVRSSNVAFYDCQIVGGFGGSDFDGDATGAPGGTGLDNRDGFVFAAGGSIAGGGGGWGDGTGYACYADGGDGGTGVVLGSAAASIEVLDVTISGGAGGQATGFCASLIDGSPGQPIVAAPGSVFADLMNAARTIDVEAPAFEFSPTMITARGVPGDDVYLILTDATEFTYPHPIPSIIGPKLYAQPVIRRFFVGTIGASGELIAVVPVPALPAGTPNDLLFWQGALDDGSSIWGTESEPWIILDDALKGP